MQADIAIVTVAYNRPTAFARLISSLENANYEGFKNISLIISIDFSNVDDCIELANNFNWVYGPKQVIAHKQNLGLKNHILASGDLSFEYDAIIILEDDLFVSPFFYDFAQQAFAFYKNEDHVAGIGLYNYRFNEFAYCPFDPIDDGFDNYFLQVPCSWGQLWTTKQWRLFKEYFSAVKKEDQCVLPEAALLWPSATSWKKIFFDYLVTTHRYFVYPRISLTTNFGDTGQHYNQEVLVWQTSLLMDKMVFRFSKLDHSSAVYDAFFELHPKVFNKFNDCDLDVCIDINGTKSISTINTQYLISAKKCSKPIKKYPLAFYPYENNLLMGFDNKNMAENYLSFGLTQYFKNELNVDRRTIDIKRIFFNETFLISSGRNEIYRSKEYKTGKWFLKPIRYMRRLLGV